MRIHLRSTEFIGRVMPGNTGRGVGKKVREGKGRESVKGYQTVCTVGTWDLTPLGTSGSQ